MKTLKTILWITLLQLTMSHARALNVSVDERIELMSILARTAGYGEYSGNQSRSYADDINAYFDKYRNHTAVKYMQAIRNDYQVAYDAVMHIAINLQIEEGHVQWLHGGKGVTEQRVSKIDKEVFIAKTDSFYQQTNFHQFFTRYRPFYDSVCEAFRQEVFNRFDSSWYAKFYGKKAVEGFNIIIGCSNGMGNYGPSREIEGYQKENFAIIGLAINNDGKPNYNGCLNTLIHEFCHSFCPRNLLQNCPELKGKYEKAMQYFMFTTGQIMQQQAYGAPEIVANESLVRASVICYLVDHNVNNTFSEMVSEISYGFRWLPGLVKVLRKYQRSRDQYPTIDDFCPEIVNYFYQFADGEANLIKESIRP